MIEIVSGIIVLAVAGLHWFAIRLPEKYLQCHERLMNPIIYILVGAAIAAFALSYRDMSSALQEISRNEQASIQSIEDIVRAAKFEFELALALLMGGVFVNYYSKFLIKIPHWLSESKNDT